MKILYCNKYNFPFGGTEVHLFEAMELMRSHGHETALFSTAHPGAPASPFDRHLLPTMNFQDRRLGVLSRLRVAGHVIYSVEARHRLRRLLEEFQPDIAHVRGIYHHLSPSIFWELRSQNIPVVYHLNDFKLLCPSYNLVSHGKICERCRGGKFRHVVTETCHNGPRGAAFVLAAEAYLHRWFGTYEKCVDVFLAPSHFARDKLVEHGWAGSRIEVLPHFQRIGDASPPEIPADAPILYFGRLSPEKGVADLLHAMKALPSVRLLVAGEGPQREELQGLARALHLENVRFVGHKTGADLERLITSSQFTVFPSRAYEILGKSILESYARGRAVVATDLGSRREFVQHGKTGLLYPPGSVGQLACAISTLSTQPQLSARMGQAGCDLLREQHGEGPYYSRLVELYEQLRSSKNRLGHAKIPVPKPKLRVAFIGGRGVLSGYSGIETWFEEVGKRLAGSGHKVTVYCRSHFTPNVREHQGMRLVRLPTIRSKHLETPIHTLLSTLHAMFGGYDVVHYQALGPALFSLLPRLVGKHTVVTVQGLDWQRSKWGGAARAVLRLGEWASARFPNATVVVAQTLRDYYQMRYGITPAHVPNGTIIRYSRDPLRVCKWGIEPGKYVLYLGRFSPEKNCRLLIETYRRIDTEVKLVLAGGAGPNDVWTKELHRRESARIRILGWVSGPDLSELLTNAMLFVLPSDVEGLSLALLDAMGAGVCVLASNIPENCEAVGDAGFTFERGNSQDLERMLRLLIHNRRMRHTAGQLARQRVREHYLWTKISVAMEYMYAEVLRNANQARAAASLESSRDPRAA